MIGYSVLRQIALKLYLYKNENESDDAQDGFIENRIQFSAYISKR